ncbi:hypothetical protein G4B88_007548 [Cannabis sativa]|uniref:Serine-threonine/tyrosine-protein kinase catalytic domain-containing protein n=1 Tax=Cannabis sativa TaxID=3483 RepID=A0A7J6HU31_CANSA|nr:hypothetical protein G4B88_007548 [Cannabis sativa]
MNRLSPISLSHKEDVGASMTAIRRWVFTMDSRYLHNQISGYLDPEYMIRGIISVKIDVYSFGVLLLEIISGLRSFSINDNNGQEQLVATVWRNWRARTSVNIVDPCMR